MGTQNAEPSGTSEDAQHSAIPPRSERGLDGEAAREERNRCRSCDASCDSEDDTMELSDYEALGRRGRTLLASGKFEDAVSELSLALQSVACPSTEAELLADRSEAFASLSKGLLGLPASNSEQHALYGADPFQLSQMALKDARRAASLRANWPRALYLQGAAHLLLESYADAEASFLAGLAADPASRKAAEGLAAARGAIALVPAASAAAAAAASASAAAAASVASPPKRARRAETMVDDMECILCLKLLYEPVTTPCGHTFCRGCFMRSTDHNNKCPMCRTVLHVGRELPVTIALKSIIEKMFPEEYEQRRLEARGIIGGMEGDEAPLPLFVMACMMPGEKMALNVFEPRYRLMIRRCMEGNRRFGMATVSSSHQLHEVACESEITECQPLPDGRFYLEVTGRRRFQLTESWEQDGYRIAKPKFFTDAAPDPTSAAGAEMRQVCAEVENLASAWVERVKTVAPMGRRGIRVMELLNRAGEKPGSEDHEALSFWVANLLPMDTPERLRLLSMTSTLERLNLEKQFLQRNIEGADSGCRVA